MIFWKDFILDDGLGPVLSPDLFSGLEEVRRDLRVNRSRVKDDASVRTSIQETRREDELLRGTNTGCVRTASWTKVQAQGMASIDLETDVSSHMEVENEGTESRQRGAG